MISLLSVVHIFSDPGNARISPRQQTTKSNNRIQYGWQLAEIRITNYWTQMKEYETN